MVAMLEDRSRSIYYRDPDPSEERPIASHLPGLMYRRIA